jgi:hypothetical protein
MFAYELTEGKRKKARRIDNSLKSNYVLTYIFLTHKRRKAEYANVLRELRNEIPLNFIKFIIFSEDEFRSKKYRRIVSNINNFENKNFDDSNFVQNYIKFHFSHFSNFSKKNEKK